MCNKIIEGWVHRGLYWLKFELGEIGIMVEIQLG